MKISLISFKVVTPKRTESKTQCPERRRPIESVHRNESFFSVLLAIHIKHGFFRHDDDVENHRHVKKILYGEQTNNKVPSKYHRHTQKSDTLEREDRLFDLMGSHEKVRNFDVRW